MRFPLKIKRDEQGFAHHFLAPVLAVVLVAVIGGVTYNLISHAATDCGATIISSGSKGDSAGNCTTYSQQMVNGILAYMYLNSNGTSLAARTNTVKSINTWPLSKVGGNGNFDVKGASNEFGQLNNPYNGTDAGWVKKIQAGITSTSTEVGLGFGGVNPRSALTPLGSLSVNGNVDKPTWGALCVATNFIASTNEENSNNSTDLDAKGNKLAMWFIRSYMRTGITAASSAQCSNILNSKTTTPPPTTKAAWALLPGTTSGVKKASSTAAGITVSYTATIKNGGSTGIAANKFNYSMRYFVYKMASGSTAWPAATATGYPGEKAIGANRANTALASGVNLSASAATPVVAIPTAKSIAKGTKEYLCVTVAFPKSANSTTMDGRNSVGAAQCFLIQTGTGTTTTVSSATATVGTGSNGAIACNGTVGGVSNIGSVALNPNNSNNLRVCSDLQGPHFRVAQASTGALPYPALFVGQHWGSFSPNDPFRNGAVSVASMIGSNGQGNGKVTTSYVTTTAGVGGTWDDSYDIWFNAAKNPGTADAYNAQTPDSKFNPPFRSLEMMIWLDHSGAGPAGGDNPVGTFSIGGVQFTAYYQDSKVQNGQDLNGSTISYLTTAHLSSIKNLDLGAMAANAIQLSQKYSDHMTTAWYLTGVEAGFEVWNGGVGLTANNFSVNVK